MKSNSLFLSLTLCSGILAAACAHESGARPAPPPAALELKEDNPVAEPATAVVSPGPDSTVHGVVKFVPDSDGVRVVARIEGLAPNSVHGFHIHAYGDCSDPTFMSAGDHLNPAGHPHGSPDSKERHLGDLGNLTSDLNGVALYERVLTGVEAPRVLVGRAIIVHQSADDTKTQPGGNSGGRVACGVIGIARR